MQEKLHRGVKFFTRFKTRIAPTAYTPPSPPQWTGAFAASTDAARPPPKARSAPAARVRRRGRLPILSNTPPKKPNNPAKIGSVLGNAYRNAFLTARSPALQQQPVYTHRVRNAIYILQFRESVLYYLLISTKRRDLM